MKKWQIILILLFTIVACTEPKKKEEDTVSKFPNNTTTADNNDTIITVIDSADNSSLSEFSEFEPIQATPAYTEIDLQNSSKVSVEQIEQALQRHPTLIPDTPVLGGTFIIHQIKILNDTLALANYEDGHKGGYLLLQLSIGLDNKVKIRPLKVKKY